MLANRTSQRESSPSSPSSAAQFGLGGGEQRGGPLIQRASALGQVGEHPGFIEFKRAHLYNFNPVGFGSMIIASVISIVAYYNAFGANAKAFSPLIALVVAMVLSPLFAWVTKGKYYIARIDTLQPPMVTDEGLMSAVEMDCVVCGDTFERPDMAACPQHSGIICSLCCSLDSKCHDTCKKPASATVDLGMPTIA